MNQIENVIFAIGEELHISQKKSIYGFAYNEVRQMPWPATAAIPAFEQTFSVKKWKPMEVSKELLFRWHQTIESWLGKKINIDLLSNNVYKFKYPEDITTMFSDKLSRVHPLELSILFSLRKHNNDKFITVFPYNKNTNVGRIADVITALRVSKKVILVTNQKGEIENKFKNLEQIVLNEDFSLSDLKEKLITEGFIKEDKAPEEKEVDKEENK